jgi:hypothetical protein
MRKHLIALCVVLSAAFTVAVSGAFAAGSTPLIGAGTGTFAAGSGTGSDSTNLSTETPGLEVDEDVPNSGNSSARVPSSGVPTPTGSAADASSAGTHGFAGLNHADSRFAGTGIYTNTNFSLEPPDQALCVGGGHVVESVNDAIRVFTTGGSAVTAATALPEFFGLRPSINRVTGVRGDFVSDPKCIYDAANHRFIVSILQAGQNPGGGFDGTGGVYVAVSKTSNPARSWSISHFSTANDGVNGPTGCPCLGDQPLLGQDAYGIYLTTNSFPFFANGFNGAWVYAISKTALYSGTSSTVWKQYVGDQTADQGGLAYSLQPADTPSDTGPNNSGTEYFLSAFDFSATLDNRIAEWTLTGTSNLAAGGTPTAATVKQVIDTEVYGQPPTAEQSVDGPFPLLTAGTQSALGWGTPAQFHVATLNTNDDRMNEVKLAGGKLYGAVNTVVKTPNGPTHTGIAYFVVNAASGSLATNGYITVNQENVFFPAIAVNSAGKGIVGMTIVGSDMHPSTAYAPLTSGGAGSVVISGVGPVGEDGFTGYSNGATGATTNLKSVARWGDYGAASVDETGGLWVANETTSNTRSLLANWGTYVSHVAP